MRSARLWPGVLLCIALLAGERPGEASPRADVGAFRSIAGKGEGYSQGWNVSVLGADLTLHISLLVTNYGPGDENNGLSVVLSQGGEDRVWTAAYSSRSLTATPGEYGVKIGRTRLFREDGRIHLRLWAPGIAGELELQPEGQGFDLFGGPLYLDAERSRRMEIAIPVVSAAVRGELRIQNEAPIAVSGRGGMEYGFADHLLYQTL